MGLLQDVEVATHHEQQQALDLHFDEAVATNHGAIIAENRSDQQRNDPAALILNVGDGRHLKHA